MTTSNAEAAARRAAHGLIEHMGTCGGTGGGCSSLEDRLTAYILTTETRLAAAEEALIKVRDCDDPSACFSCRDISRRALAEPPGEGAGALTPGTGRGEVKP